MKIRLGFVSNSSTSSFCIYGVCLDKQEIFEMLQERNPTLIAENEDLDACYDDIDIAEELDVLIKKLKLDLEFYKIPYDEVIYVGRSWSYVGNDETGKQFKESIQSDVDKLLLDNFKKKELKCSSIEKAWHD